MCNLHNCMTPNKQPAISTCSSWAMGNCSGERLCSQHITRIMCLKGMASSLQHHYNHVNGTGHGRSFCATDYHLDLQISSAAPISDPTIQCPIVDSEFSSFRVDNRKTFEKSMDYIPRKRSTKWMVDSFWMLYSSRVRSFSSSLPAKTALC